MHYALEDSCSRDTIQSQKSQGLFQTISNYFKGTQKRLLNISTADISQEPLLDQVSKQTKGEGN